MLVSRSCRAGILPLVPRRLRQVCTSDSGSREDGEDHVQRRLLQAGLGFLKTQRDVDQLMENVANRGAGADVTKLVRKIKCLPPTRCLVLLLNNPPPPPPSSSSSTTLPLLPPPPPTPPPPPQLTLRREYHQLTRQINQLTHERNTNAKMFHSVKVSTYGAPTANSRHCHHGLSLQSESEKKQLALRGAELKQTFAELEVSMDTKATQLVDDLY